MFFLKHYHTALKGVFMSMHYEVYIGPYVECKDPKPGKELEVDTHLHDRLSQLRGEFSVQDGDTVYLGANIKTPSLPRRMKYGYWNQNPDILLPVDSKQEIDAFTLEFGEEVEILDGFFRSVAIRWGVVPGFS
jgi:hypothetical protein